MDAVEFVKTVNRLCKNRHCDGCPVAKEGRCMVGFDYYSVKNIEETISKVEQWAKDHPVKTRQSEFLKMFPNAVIKNGTIAICPQNVCESYTPEDGCIYTACGLCRKRFWLAEVTDND